MEEQPRFFPCLDETPSFRLSRTPETIVLRISDLDVKTIMGAVPGFSILVISAELQIDCFSALGEVDSTLANALKMSMTNKKLYEVYEKYRLTINRHIFASSIQAFTNSSLTSDNS